MKHRYFGESRWDYWMDGNTNKPAIGTVYIEIPTGNYKEDEGFARYLLRKKIAVKRLPKGVHVAPRR